MKRHASMNRVYRLVWSQVRNAWVAAAETARGRGKGSSRKLIAAALSLSAAIAQAAPIGGQLAAGAGSISQSGATTTIQQSSQNLSLNWNSFNIAPQETVNFLQPSASAIAVNRIFDTNGTQILGRLNANGQVWLINPNGILFGQGAQVNVGGLIASTLNLNDATLNGNARSFSGNGTGSIVNQGSINAADGGYVALLGNTVGNQGTIAARLGTVALGAGSAATLTFSGNSPVKMQVDQSVLASLAENGGLINADGGMVLMSAGAKNALLASVVNNTGIIEARTVENHEGVIILLGGMTAGTVNVGGTLDASAPNGGNGGFIETSAANVKAANSARITTAAPNGKTGMWLIDPVDITIAASGGNVTGATIATALQSTDVTLDTSGTGSCTGVACGALGGTNGDIFVNDNINTSASLGATRTLTLKADRNIVFQTGKGIDATTGGNTQKLNVVLNADADASGAGNIQMKTGASITTNGGNITLGGGADPLTTAAVGSSITLQEYYGVHLADATLNAGAGNISIRGRGLADPFAGIGIFAGGNAGGTVIQTTSGDITLIGTGGAGAVGRVGVWLEGAGTNIASSNGAISITGQAAGTDSSNHGIFMQGGAAITSADTATITLDGTGGTGTNDNYGVLISDAGTHIASLNGAISITGLGAGTAERNIGIIISNGAKVTSTGTATITLNGTGAAGTDNNNGVDLIGFGTNIESSNGAISITGHGAGTGVGNYGIRIISAAVTSADTATITLNGTGGEGTDNNYGVSLSDFGANIESSNGAISITGRSAGTGLANHGIVMADTAAVTSTGAATITLDGKGGPGTDNNSGVYLTGADTKITSTTGEISIKGQGAGTGAANYGISMDAGAAVTSTDAARIILNGTGGAGVDDNYGVWLSGFGTNITSSTGAISITGQGAGTGARNYGIFMDSEAAVTSMDTATITLNGTGGAGTDDNYGVYLSGGNTITSSVDGAISITGQGAGTGLANYGIFMDEGAAVSSTDAANITLDGRGAGVAEGIHASTSGDNNIIGDAASTGNITLIAHTATGADSIFLSGLEISGTGTLVLQPLQPATTIGLAGGAGTFNLDATTELPTIQSGFASITIGRDNGTGLIAFGDGAGAETGFAFNANTTLRNPGVSSNGITITDPLSVGVKNLTFNTTGTSTQTAAVTAAGLELLGAGGTHTLTDTDTGFSAGNAITTLAGDTGAVNYQQTGSLAIGSVGATTGLTAANGILVRTTGASTDLTLTNGVTANGAGDALVLAAGRNFLNNVGAGALDAPNGRWLGYSTSPAGSTENGLTALAGSTSPRLYNRTFAGNAPASIAAGNHLIYSTQPTLTVTADDKTRAYGDANPSFTTTTTGGFVSDDGVTDTLATAGLTGAAALSSLATATSPVSSSPFTISAAAGDLASSAGYNFGFVDGTLTINKAHLTVTADDKTRLYGAVNPALTTTVSGFVNGENAGTAAGFTGVGNAMTLANATTNVGTALITAGAGNLAAANYDFATLVNSTLIINKAPLTVTADDKTRLYGAANPILTSTVSGFVNGENAGTAAGFIGAANATTAAGATTPDGTALITAGAGSLAATNYAFTRLVDGTLTIIPATPAVQPDIQLKPVETAPAQLQSSILAPQASTRPEEISLSPTLTVTQRSSSDTIAAGNASSSDSGDSPAEPRWRVAIAGGDASSSGSGNGTVVNTMMNIGGGMGPSLQILNGGMKLPDNIVNMNEEKTP